MRTRTHTHTHTYTPKVHTNALIGAAMVEVDVKEEVGEAEEGNSYSTQRLSSTNASFII